MQGATGANEDIRISQKVSIHAPYAGSDQAVPVADYSEDMVSIHAPYAGSDIISFDRGNVLFAFQSTPPMQGATYIERLSECRTKFQSTPPMQGATVGTP